jgi:hypothetical protein
MSLPRAPAQYDQGDQTRLRAALDNMDSLNRKQLKSITVEPSQKLYLYDTVSGAKGYISVASGTITWTLV